MTVEQQEPQSVAAPASHSAQGSRARLPYAVLVVLWLMVTVVAVRFGMDILLLAAKGEMRDFAPLYTAAVVAKSGLSFYDPQPGKQWFGKNENPDLIAAAKKHGTFHQHDEFEHVHLFTYPPAMMFLMLPFVVVPFHVAKLVWLLFSLFAIGWGLWLLGRAIQSHTLLNLCMVFLALTFQPLRSTLDLGQVSALMFFLLVAFFALYRSGRDVSAGLVLGLATAIRFHPGLLILYLVWRREFRTASVALATALGLTVLAALVFGPEVSEVYLTQMMPKLSRALIWVQNHSLAGFLVTVGHALGFIEPTQQVSSPWTAGIAAGLVLTLTALVLSPAAPVRGSRTADLEFALILTMTFLATPIVSINYLIMILPSYWILFKDILTERGAWDMRVAYLAGLSAVLIGVVNDFYVHPFLSQGVFIFFAEIKFYGLVMLYVALALQLYAARRIQTVSAAPVVRR